MASRRKKNACRSENRNMNMLDFLPYVSPWTNTTSTPSIVIVMRSLMMPPVISALFACMATLFRSRASLHLEHLALRHQLMVYQRSVPDRPPCDRSSVLGVAISSVVRLARSLAFVQPAP